MYMYISPYSAPQPSSKSAHKQVAGTKDFIRWRSYLSDCSSKVLVKQASSRLLDWRMTVMLETVGLQPQTRVPSLAR